MLGKGKLQGDSKGWRYNDTLVGSGSRVQYALSQSSPGSNFMSRDWTAQR